MILGSATRDVTSMTATHSVFHRGLIHWAAELKFTGKGTVMSEQHRQSQFGEYIFFLLWFGYKMQPK